MKVQLSRHFIVCPSLSHCFFCCLSLLSPRYRLKLHVVSQFSTRLMMHVFFAPHPSLIPLRFLSYDHPFVFFVRPSLYITLQDPTSFALNLLSPRVFPLTLIVFYTYSWPQGRLKHREYTYTCSRFVLNSHGRVVLTRVPLLVLCNLTLHLAERS